MSFSEHPYQPFHATILPGPDRKKSEQLYRYRLTFWNPEGDAVGCVLICDVQGGRATYQIVVERGQDGNLRMDCTCADAVFRAEAEGRLCKHVQGLLQLGGAAAVARQVRAIGA